MLNSRGTTITGLPFKTSLTAAITVSLYIATQSVFLILFLPISVKKKL